ncbi:MAG TPA: hypothetical protein VHQ03_10540 [Candidatus Dormibacteraeota bacterium]|nr:hypothetical protein [Candidatus Dormibacteraeota bacterium]
MARLVVAFALVLLSACQYPGSTHGCSNVQIDWVDFIQIGSTQYVAEPGGPTGLQESDLGPVVARVKFKVAGNVCDPNYKLKDGDAAFLEPGTPIYQVNGQPPAKALAAHRDGRLVAYMAKVP